MTGIIQNLALAAIVLLFLYIFAKSRELYSKRKRYPTGGFPLPVFGNILSLAVNLNRNPVHYFSKLAQKYGDVYTFWLGSEPVIVINDYDVAKRMLNKSEFSDRFDESVIQEFNSILMEKTTSISNYDEELKALRKVSIEAIRKYLQTDNLAINLRKIVTETANIMIEKECAKEFVPFKYIESMFVRLLIQATFGENIEFDSTVIHHIIKSFDSISENFMKIFLTGYFPLLKLLRNKSEQNSLTKQTNELMHTWFHRNLQSYRSDSTETLTHLVYSAKLRYLSAKQNNSVYEQHISDSNLIGTLFTLFLGANDTSLNTFKWMLLLMTYYPEMQRTLRDEIKCNFGDNYYPDSCDKEKCHFVNAFICETLRFRNVLPLGIFHRTKYDTNIGEEIPKGIGILINQYFMLNDLKYWINPEIFNPKRFLNSENCFDKTHLPAFIPFSTGKRMCVGDKFSMNTLFLTLTCLLQATSGYQFALTHRETTDLEPKTFGFVLEPKVYKILIKKD